MPNKKKTHKQFISEIALANPNIEIIDLYSGSNNKITCKCKIDNYIWNAYPSDLLRNHGCPKCAGVMRRTHEEFIQEMSKINHDIEIISEYKNVRSRIKCKCKIDNYIWSTIASNLLSGYGCPKCGGTIKKSKEEFEAEMKKINLDIIILSDYKNCETKIKCKCKICENIWYVKPSHLLNGIGCPSCNKSKGEKKINEFLVNNNVYFESQKTFEGLTGVNGGLLSFDYYLPDYNLLIEYQGVQHEKPVNFGFGNEYAKDKFIKQQEHDKRKSNFAFVHNYFLLNIWHYDFENINTIIFDYLNKIKKIIEPDTPLNNVYHFGSLIDN